MAAGRRQGRGNRVEKRMRLKGLLFLLLGLSFGAALGWVVFLSGSGSTARAAERRLPPTVGSPVKDFDLPVLNGKSEDASRALSESRGKPVVVNFWATWCGPCKQEMPLLQSYSEKYADKLVILGVDYNEDDAVVSQFIQERAINFPILMDRSGTVADQYFVKNFPTTFFIDGDGVLRARHIGQLTDDLLVRYLKTIGVEP